MSYRPLPSIVLMMYGARGGVYIAGGIAPRITDVHGTLAIPRTVRAERAFPNVPRSHSVERRRTPRRDIHGVEINCETRPWQLAHVPEKPAPVSIRAGPVFRIEHRAKPKRSRAHHDSTRSGCALRGGYGEKAHRHSHRWRRRSRPQLGHQDRYLPQQRERYRGRRSPSRLGGASRT